MEDSPLKDLENICENTVIHITRHFIDNNRGDRDFIITASNVLPIIDKENKKAIWQPNDLVVDIFFNRDATLSNLSSSTMISITYWIDMICSILTFKGHEVFVDGELFKPYEDSKINSNPVKEFDTFSPL